VLVSFSAFLILGAVPALLIAAAICDAGSFRIPNAFSLALAGLFPLVAVFAGLPLDVAGLHALAGAIGLAIGVTLFAFGHVGGGDAKLFAVAALWVGLDDLFGYALIASLFGGGLAVAILLLRRAPMPALLTGQGWLLRLADPKSGVPYGVALAAAALAVLPQTELFRLAAG